MCSTVSFPQSTRPVRARCVTRNGGCLDEEPNFNSKTSRFDRTGRPYMAQFKSVRCISTHMSPLWGWHFWGFYKLVLKAIVYDSQFVAYELCALWPSCKAALAKRLRCLVACVQLGTAPGKDILCCFGHHDAQNRNLSTKTSAPLRFVFTPLSRHPSPPTTTDLTNPRRIFAFKHRYLFTNL